MVWDSLGYYLLTQATIIHLGLPMLLFFKNSDVPGLHRAGVFPVSWLGFHPPPCWPSVIDILSAGPSTRQRQSPAVNAVLQSKQLSGFLN